MSDKTQNNHETTLSDLIDACKGLIDNAKIMKIKAFKKQDRIDIRSANTDIVFQMTNPEKGVYGLHFSRFECMKKNHPELKALYEKCEGLVDATKWAMLKQKQRASQNKLNEAFKKITEYTK